MFEHGLQVSALVSQFSSTQLNSFLSIDLTTFQLEQMEKLLMVFRVHTIDQRNKNKFEWNMRSVFT